MLKREAAEPQKSEMNKQKKSIQENTYIIEEIRDFDTAHIFDCGQCFRWYRQPDGSYTGIAGERIANIRFEPYEESTRLNRQTAIYGRLIIENCCEEDFEQFWRHYLDLDRDYGKIKRTLSRGDATMRKAIRFGQGIRILNQDLWEVIISFIISQNNNIPRIRGCIEKLAELLGEEAGEYQGRIWYKLPDPYRLAEAEPADLEPVRLGYRARYLIETARMVCRNGLPSEKEELAKLCGVGPKVAACISLFGMNGYNSFPVDVWVARVMHQLYNLDEKDKTAISDFAERKFGCLGGFAQQYLFYYIRETQKGKNER